MEEIGTAMRGISVSPRALPKSPRARHGHSNLEKLNMLMLTYVVSKKKPPYYIKDSVLYICTVHHILDGVLFLLILIPLDFTSTNFMFCAKDCRPQTSVRLRREFQSPPPPACPEKTFFPGAGAEFES